MSWEIAVIIGSLGIAFAFFYISHFLHEQHTPLKLLMIIAGLIGLLLTVDIERNVMLTANETSNLTDTTPFTVMTNRAVNQFQLISWAFIFGIFYFVIMFIYAVFKMMKVKKKYGKGGLGSGFGNIGEDLKD